jgi:hypothetical protein
MLNCRYMVITREDLQAWIDGPGAVTDKTYSRKPAKARAGEEAA